MQHRDFLCINETDVNLSHEDTAKISMEIQKALLISLQKRNLLTQDQVISCIKQLEKQCNKNIIQPY